jgi:UDP-3-O-[3-hydroxymyristoyl] glucosamine N-acyltransferase
LRTLAQIADHLNGVWHGNANHAIFSFASLHRAKSTDIAYYDAKIPIHLLQATQAGAVLLKEEHVACCSTNAIIVDNPFAAMHIIKDLLSYVPMSDFTIHPSAVIHPTAKVASGVSIGAFTVIGEHVELSTGVIIGDNSVIEMLVTIKENCRVGHGVKISAGVSLGEQVVIHSGAVIGTTPFNFIKAHGTWHAEPSVGGVIIGDRVVIGSNTVVCKGSLGDTYIDEGVCIDNLVQIANDVMIGKNTAIAGSATIGSYVHIGADCIIGGASTLASNVSLADDVVITGMSAVNKSITKPGIYSSGTIAHEHQRWRKNASRFKRLDDYINKLNQLEKKLEHI